MTDYQELKRLAEAAKRSGEENGERWPQDDDWFEPDLISDEMSFVKAVSPANVLALIAEVEALRNLKLPDYLKLSDEMRAAGDHAERRAREDGCCSVHSLSSVFFETAIQVWLNNNEEAIDAAISKESANGQAT